MRGLLNAAAERALRYLETLDDRSVAPGAEAIRRLSDLGGPLQEAPMDPEKVLALLDDIGSPATVATAGRRYFGFVIGGALPAAVAANWLAGAWDQNAGSSVASPVAIALETTAVRWLARALPVPDDSFGAFVTGTTMANFAGLAAARHAVLAEAGWDVEAKGLFGAPEITVVVGAEAHASLYRAIGLAGFGRERVTVVPVDGQGAMRPDAFPRVDGPAIVCLQAGNVNTGAFDPAGEICAKARAAGAWVHVDGAFGLWAGVAPARAHLVDGYEAADSWATDAHKWLNVPYDSGLILTRRPDALHAAMAMSASYLPPSDAGDPMYYTPEASRRARGIEAWAALKSLGRSGLADLVERNCRYAARFAAGLRKAGFSVLNDVELNQVLVAFGDDEATRRVIKGIQDDGTCWCGGTVWRGKAAMRISVSSWATTEEDVDRSLDAMIRVASVG